TMVQYTFMVAIGYGNAAIATVLQCTGPIYIILYAVMKKYRPWTKTEAFIIGAMIIGVTLIATNGNLTNLAVSPVALMFGLASGVALARSEEHTSELQSRFDLVCRLLLEQKNYIACLACTIS